MELKGTLTLSPQRRGPPWTWRPGTRLPHACSAHRAPAPSKPLSAHPTGLPQPPAPRPGEPKAAGARRPGRTGPPPVQHSIAPQTESPTLTPAPAPASSPGASGRLDPAPGPAAAVAANHRSGPLHHFRTRPHVTRASPTPRRRGLGAASRNPGGGALRRVGESQCSPTFPTQASGEEMLVPFWGAIRFSSYALVPDLYNHFTFPVPLTHLILITYDL